MEMKDLILDTKLFIPGKETEYVTIKPKKLDKQQNETDQQWYWFAIYDLCQVNANSSVSLKIENKIGSFSGMIEA